MKGRHNLSQLMAARHEQLSVMFGDASRNGWLAEGIRAVSLVCLQSAAFQIQDRVGKNIRFAAIVSDVQRGDLRFCVEVA